MNDRLTRTNLPVVVEGEVAKTGQASPSRSDQAFQAQVLGQDGQKRGLRGGKPVLDAARSAYLETEWRGEYDRRLPPGTLRRVRL